MFKKIQFGAITIYRWVAVGLLFAIVGGVMWYIGSLFFFAANRSWAAPITLSPTQGKVLAYQPQIASLEGSLAKQKVDLETALSRYESGTKELETVEELLSRMDMARQTEAKSLAAINDEVGVVLKAKYRDISATRTVTADVKEMMATVDAELKMGLITRDQAQSRRISLQAALNSTTDAQSQVLTLREQARSSLMGSKTLSGASSSLQALQAVQEAVQLRIARTTLWIDTQTAQSSIVQLKEGIRENERVLNVAKTSPYYKALREPVNVLFMPYDNMGGVKPGQPVYDCLLQFIVCSEVGRVTEIYEAEEYARHPSFKTDVKGKFVAVKYTDPTAGESAVMFTGRKPFFF